jgi:glycerate dehydrogenase
MRIVVLDGYTLNPGDLSWEKLEQLGECVVYDRTVPVQTVSRARAAQILLTNKTVLSGEMLEQLPECRYIAVTATGYNVVDTAAAKARGIAVANVPSYGTESVAQTVFAHVLNLTQHVAYHAATVRRGRWSATPDFCYWDYPMIELSGKTMGIVGFGQIGRTVAWLARAFGMRVLAYSRSANPASETDAQIVKLDTVFHESDIVSLHCPLTFKTEKLVNVARLALMKQTAFLINTSRGRLVDEYALAQALNAGQIAGAGLDVLAVEPPLADNPLVKAKNCYITPHIAWATREARSRLMEAVTKNVKAFIDGRPINIVNL